MNRLTVSAGLLSLILAGCGGGGGKGCVNTNKSNASVTQQGYKDVLEFFFN